MPEDEVTQAEQQPQSDAEGPSFEQFSKDREAGKVDATAGGDEHSPGGDQWDGKKWANKTPREDSGRFAKVRESMERSQKRSTYVKAVLEGAVEPDESTMDADTWAAARNAQIARGTNKITPPEFPDEKPADAGAQGKEAEQELSPEEIKHFEVHDSFMSRVAAKIAIDPETRSARDGLTVALERGAPPDAMRYMGHCIADTDNPHEVFLALGKNPEAIVMYTQLNPPAMRSAILALSRELVSQSTHAKAAPAPKPKPPDPVSTRASSSAFDVNDESIDADTWGRLRNESLAKRGRR